MEPPLYGITFALESGLLLAALLRLPLPREVAPQLRDNCASLYLLPPALRAAVSLRRRKRDPVAMNFPMPGKEGSSMPEPKNLYEKAILTVSMGMQDNCLIKGAVSGVVGGLAGVAFGVILAPFEFSNLPHTAPMKQQFLESFRQMYTRGSSWGKNFAKIGVMFSVTECAIEKVTARSSIWTTTGAGCVTGAMLGYKGGPLAIVGGGVGFGAFTLAIEWFMHRDD